MMFAVDWAAGNLLLSTKYHNNLLLRQNKAHFIRGFFLENNFIER